MIWMIINNIKKILKFKIIIKNNINFKKIKLMIKRIKLKLQIINIDKKY